MSRQDFTKEIPREERKLDTLARFITGHSVCVAVIFQQLPERNSQLIISTNKMSKADAKKLNSHFLAGNKEELDSDSNKELMNNLPLLTKIKNEGSYDSKEIQEELKGVFGRGFPSKIFATLQSSVTKVKSFNEDDNDQYQALIESKNKSNYYKAIEHFYLNKAKFIDAAKILSDEKKFLLQFISHVEEIYQRINHDVRQLIRIIKFDDDFANTIAKGHFTFAAPKEDNENDAKNNHAEMNIVHYLIEHDLFETWYVGVSKLCCFHCANDIAMINAHKGGLKLLVRGEHGVGFSAERVSSDFSKYLALKEESAESMEEFCIRLLLGKKTLDEYLARLEEGRNAQAFLQALMSDSDEENAVVHAGAGGAGVSSSHLYIGSTTNTPLIGESLLAEAAAGAGII